MVRCHYEPRAGSADGQKQVAAPEARFLGKTGPLPERRSRNGCRTVVVRSAAVKKWDGLPAHVQKSRGKRLVQGACPNFFTSSPRTIRLVRGANQDSNFSNDAYLPLVIVVDRSLGQKLGQPPPRLLAGDRFRAAGGYNALSSTQPQVLGHESGVRNSFFSETRDS
jgi:hypothetical protein